MSVKRNLSQVREVVGVFSNVETLEDAIDKLLESGFNRSDMSLLVGAHRVEEELGHIYTKVEELEDDSRVPRTAYIARESVGDAEGVLIGAPMYIAAFTATGLAAAAGGPLVAIIIAAVIGGGGGALIGTILAHMVGKRHADYIEQQLEHGGLLLWVRTWNVDQEKRAKDILRTFSAHDVHVHDLHSQTGPTKSKRYENFTSPEAVFNATDLMRNEKVRILKSFEYDARELSVATGEGMGNDSSDLLDRVLKALRALESGPDPAHSPQTKQGGP